MKLRKDRLWLLAILAFPLIFNLGLAVFNIITVRLDLAIINLCSAGLCGFTALMLSWALVE